MDVFTVAAELLGDLQLTSGQLGQLRALEYRLLLESLRRDHAPSREEEVDLRAEVVDEIVQMLTPDQRARLDRGPTRSGPRRV
jgi:hypothetical protein